MPSVTIIVGGPGSGKSKELLSRLAARYAADPFSETAVLVPTVRHGDQFRRRLVARCGVALRLRVETISQFSRGLVSGLWMPSFALTEELLARTIRREVEGGPAAYFAPIASTKGLRGLLSGAIADLLAEAVDPQALSAAAGKTGLPSLTALSAMYAAYTAEFERRGWVHPAQIAVAAAAAVKAGAALPPRVMLDGFQVLRGTEIALLETVSERADVVIAIDPSAGARAEFDCERLLKRLPGADVLKLAGNGATQPETVIAGKAPDREGQLRAIARQIKHRLTEDTSLRPSDFAVTFRRMPPYLSLARQVFAEYDLPLDPAAGERLSAKPLGAWVRRLLHLAEDGWHLRDLAAVLSSGFIDLGRWGLTRGDVALFTRRARDTHFWAGKDALERVTAGLRTEANSPEMPGADREPLRRVSDGMATALQELAALLEQPPYSTAEHARRMEVALFGSRPLISPASRVQPGAALELDALRGQLTELVSTHETLGGGPEPFDAFRARFEGKLDAAAVVLREVGGVLLAPMHTLHGLRFDFLAVGGLIEGEFPAPRSAAALLDSNAVQVLNQAGLGLPPEARLAEDELWRSVSTRADRTLCLWRTRIDERGRPAVASYYFDSLAPGETVDAVMPAPELAGSRRELAIACSRQWSSGGRLRPRGEPAWPVVRTAVAIEQLRRSFAHAHVYEGRLAAGLVPRLTGANAVWSATRIESYRTCAFQFFGQYGLRLREVEQETDSADAAARGSVIHEMLEDALGPIIERGEPLLPEVLGEAIERLWSNGLEIWNSAPSRWGFGRSALWRLDAEKTLHQVELLLEREARLSRETGVTRIIGAEQRIEASLPLDPPMRVIALLDRMDAGDDLVAVVDYKSGRQIPRAHVEDGRRIQLQLYGYLGREEARAARVIARYAWLDPNNRQWDIDTARGEDAALLDNVVAIAHEVRSAVDSGDFRVNPMVQPCPSYCAMRHVCRVNEFSRWKSWD